MSDAEYQKLYEKIFRVLGDLTPLRADCGLLCNGACCKGDENTGMRLFPGEESPLQVKQLESGDRLAVCNGTCDRSKRPLACRIFPFFPTIDGDGKIYVEEDDRARTVCPMVGHSDEILYDERFLRAVKKVGQMLAKDDSCREFLYRTTEEIDTYRKFYGLDEEE